MLSELDNELLTRVGPGTPMGNLLRRYWHPITVASELDENPTKAIRLMGEDLTLYRDRSGNLGLIEDRCPHRKVNMLYGIPEEEGLRCPYHGWLFNHTGQCLEQPYEQAEDPNSNFKEKITIKAYRVEELGGVIFAYMGPAPAPLLPRWDLFVMDNVYRDAAACVIPCNWLQIMENSLDPIHAEWLHGYFSDYVLERLGQDTRVMTWIKDRFVARTWQHKKIGFDIFEHGIIKRRILEGESEEDENWKVGHPILFPQILRSGGGVSDKGGVLNFQYRVPVDDEHTYHFWYTVYVPPKGTMEPPQTTIPFYEVTLPHPDEHGQPIWPLLDNAPGQDLMAWMTQGKIADRPTEKLGLSDKGIIMYRRLLKAQLERMERGEELMNEFRDPARNELIPVPQEMRGGINFPFRAQGNSGLEVWRLRTPGTVQELYPEWINTGRPLVADK